MNQEIDNNTFNIEALRLKYDTAVTVIADLQDHVNHIQNRLSQLEERVSGLDEKRGAR